MATSDLDITSSLPTNVAIEDDYVTRVAPVRSLDNHGPLEFFVEPSATDLTHITEHFLKISVCAKRNNKPVKHVKALTDSHREDPSSIDFNATGTAAGAPDEDAKLSCNNNLVGSLFSQCSIYFNNVLIENVTDYAFISYLTTLLGYDKDAKTSALEYLVGWYEDKPGAFNLDTNPAFQKRIRYLLLNGRECHLKCKLALGITHMHRFIPNHISIKIVLHRKKPEFAFQFLGLESAKPAGEYTLEITRATFEVRRVKVLPSVLQNYEEQLSKELGQFPFKRLQCRAFNLQKDQTDVTLQNMFSGELPSSVLICMVPNSTYNGDLYSNSYNLEHLDLGKAALYANGKEFPTHGYEINMKKHDYADAYLSLFTGFSQFHSITREEFSKGSFMLYFDMDPSGDELVSSMPNGVVSGKFTFNTELAKTTTLLAIASFNVKLFIDHMRNFTFTYTP